ncbi:MAG: hypothetical protein ABI967_16875, partial [bacterium]
MMVGCARIGFRRQCLVALFGVFALLVCSPFRFRSVAQTARPILVSEESSTRALVFDSVTKQREPFSPIQSVGFGGDTRTRVMLFAMQLELQPGDTASAVTVQAEDGTHHIYSLPVEYVGPTPDQPWATAVIVRLDSTMGDVGDVLVKLTYRGVSSNRVRVGIGHIGAGLVDDPGAAPTPGTIAPPVFAGTLTTGDVQTIISQAVSAAVALGHPITVAVTDREGNSLGVFSMTGAPAATTIRSVGTLGSGLEGTVAPASLAALSKAGTGALFSTSGNAFTTRTAGFIIQEHFP